MSLRKPHTVAWFERRIGKRIYRVVGWCSAFRRPGSCPCNESRTKGLEVFSEAHADTLYSCQLERGYRYADRPRRR